MKKQYYVSKEHNFKRKVILFYDGEPVSYYDGACSKVDKFITDIEKQGYTRGYLPREISAQEALCRMMSANVIDFDDRDPRETLIEVLGNE